MRVRWFGQSAFLLAGEQRVFIDPFGSLEGLAARGLEFNYPPIRDIHAELVLVTHEHVDHNAAELVTGSPTVIRSTAGRFASPIGEIVAIASEHDDEAGTLRGPNTIFCFELDGLRVCHFGDFGQKELRAAQTRSIGAVDVLFLPVGGGPTLDGETAARIARSLSPRLVIPMHYRTPSINFLEPVDAFRDEFAPDAKPLAESELEVEQLLGAGGHARLALLAPPLAD
jgi:L-ascorbate metabolism protein UlaG (beta-lactamase superfamily)